MAVVEASKPDLITTSKPSVFHRGNLTVSCFKVETSTDNTDSPPKPLFIVTPTLAASYPVLLFFHGTSLSNTSYSQLLQHISSHGYIVVAPQLYVCVLSSGTEEVKSAAAVANWLHTGLQAVLPSDEIKANLKKLALIGHSRGGKAAFALALGYAHQTVPDISTVIGIDPVAGWSSNRQTEPKVLTYVPNSFDLKIPVTVIGTGLGDQKKNFMTPACAPNKVNHKEFFAECKPICCYFVAKDYGHMDMLDEGISAIGSCLCACGKGSKSPMRSCIGGLVVACLEAHLQDDSKDLMAIVNDPSIAPIALDPVTYNIKA